MKTSIAIEEAAQFALTILAISQLPISIHWWIVPAFFAPDLFAIGYLVNPKVGAFMYNLAHHKLVAILVIVAGFYFKQPYYTLAGLIIYSHSSFDRMLGYGLKYNDSFGHTHLGYIGKEAYKNKQAEA
ncbi:MAG: DUF4260 domain-containing protein [Flavipsychrobacter sp.]|nr:DUF4260 domain-containing protein [Flavipsychrobacter sp.]